MIVAPVHVSRTEPLRASPSTRRPYGSAHPHTKRPSQSITRMSHGQVHRNRVARKFNDMSVRLPAQPAEPGLLPRDLLHVRLELVVLVADRVEEQTLGEIVPALLLAHLVDEVVDFLDHVFERPIERLTRGDL